MKARVTQMSPTHHRPVTQPRLTLCGSVEGAYGLWSESTQDFPPLQISARQRDAMPVPSRAVWKPKNGGVRGRGTLSIYRNNSMCDGLHHGR